MAELEARRRCCSCGAEAPVTHTEYTLISGKHAWRCKKMTMADELQPRLVWYCPVCWKSVRPEIRR